MAEFTNDSSWQQWAHTSNAALQEADYPRAVAHSTVALDKLAHTQFGLLDIRIAGHTKTGRFAHALADAKQLIVLMPESPQGYLRTGELYRIQGKQLLALQIYNQGLRNVSVTDPAHGILMQARDAALEQSQRRVDFVAELPYDLMAHLAPYLPIETLTICLNVSKTWRERLLGCPPGWQKVVIDGAQPNSAGAYAAALAVKSHIQSLSILFMEENTPVTLFSQVAQGHFERLQTLSLRCCKIGRVVHLLSALLQIRYTLTNLTLSSIIDRAVPLQSILTICTELRTLKFKSGTDLGHVDQSLLPDTMPLTSLELQAFDMKANQLEPILRRCPNIRLLALYRCEASVLSLIYRCCPDLEHLYFNIFRMMKESENIPTDAASEGLITLHLGLVKADIVQLLPSLLSRVKDTLKTLRLEIDPDNSGPSIAWEPIWSLEFNVITSLTVNMPESFQSVISLLIGRCPNLMSMNFDYPSMVGVEVFLSLSELERLSELTINSVPHVSRAGIELFLGKHCALKHKSTLRLFEADQVKDLSAEALVLLAKIPTLETIRLDNCSKVSVEGMAMFADSLSMYSANLTRLNLCSLGGVSDSSLRALSRATRLEHIWLVRLMLPTDSGVIHLVSMSTSLKSIWIYDCGNISSYMMEYAMQVLKDKNST